MSECGYSLMAGRESGPITSASLLIRIKDPSDSDSWQIFESVYGPVVRSYCRRRGFQSSDIDDIAQEVMTAVSRAIEKFEYEPAKGSFRGWLATVTANKLKNFVSRSGFRDPKFSNTIERLESYPDSDPDWSGAFLQEVLQAACDRVRPTVEQATWQCFESTWLYDENAIEVAQRLDIPVHSVYVNKSRVLKRVEQEFLMLSEDLPMNGRHGKG